MFNIITLQKSEPGHRDVHGFGQHYMDSIRDGFEWLANTSLCLLSPSLVTESYQGQGGHGPDTGPREQLRSELARFTDRSWFQV